MKTVNLKDKDIAAFLSREKDVTEKALQKMIDTLLPSSYDNAILDIYYSARGEWECQYYNSTTGDKYFFHANVWLSEAVIQLFFTLVEEGVVLVEGSTADIIRIDGETCAFVPSNNPECDRCCLERAACKQTCLFFEKGGFFIDKLLLDLKDKKDGNESD